MNGDQWPARGGAPYLVQRRSGQRLEDTAQHANVTLSSAIRTQVKDIDVQCRHLLGLGEIF